CILMLSNSKFRREIEKSGEETRGIEYLTNLKELQISCSKVTDRGVTFLKGLHKLALLNMERCPITAACLDSLSDLVTLLYLNVSRS
ncbi:hypothetical protein L1887_19511, partial [Cichorium endivia]